MSEIRHSTEVDQILFFAGQISGHSGTSNARRVAQDKGWLDQSGRLTGAGSELLQAFREQSHTRTVFRPLC
jgi:hypothetical protein